MKKSFFLFHLILIFSCSGRTQEFSTYISHFEEIVTPLTLDRKSYNSLFFSNNKGEIQENWIQKFICMDTLNCEKNPEFYQYRYGAKYNKGAYFIAVLYKQTYEGKTIYDFDLSEVILISYSLRGEILSSIPISKDNDAWISEIELSENCIQVKQIKILEFDKPEMNCEIEVVDYQFGSNGEINKLRRSPIKNGIVIWDKQIEDFRLK